MRASRHSLAQPVMATVTDCAMHSAKWKVIARKWARLDSSQSIEANQ